MPSWGNTDANTAKPHIPEMRQVRIFTTQTTANSTAAGASTIIFNGVGAATAANVGIIAGMYVYGGGPGVVSGAGQRDFFKGNNTVASVGTGLAGNNVTLAAPTTAIVPAGTQLTFDTVVNYNNPLANTYFSDVILITPTRMANTLGTSGGIGSTVANTKLGDTNAGWNRITRKINADGTVRFLKETLIALANPVASIATSANTSANGIFSGL